LALIEQSKKRLQQQTLYKTFEKRPCSQDQRQIQILIIEGSHAVPKIDGLSTRPSRLTFSPFRRLNKIVFFKYHYYVLVVVRSLFW
jgi:hypothetical protein